MPIVYQTHKSFYLQVFDFCIFTLNSIEPNATIIFKAFFFFNMSFGIKLQVKLNLKISYAYNKERNHFIFMHAVPNDFFI